MTETKGRAVERSAAAPVHRRRSKAEARRLEGLIGPRREPYLVWFGGVIGVALVLVAMAGMAGSFGWLGTHGSPRALAADAPAESLPLGDRVSCDDIGRTNLRSPAEGLWFETNCIYANTETGTTCNRTSLDPAEFTAVAPGLYVTRQTPGSTGFLWYASSESCFDLVSARVVTAVCADRSVSFERAAKACTTHGGVLAVVNGR